MAQQITEKKYRWECPSCHSHYYDEQITFGFQKGRVVRVPPVCTKCFNECGRCKTRIEYGETCPKCGAKRRKIHLIKTELSPEDPAFGVTTTGSQAYPTTETLGDTVTPDTNGGANVLVFRKITMPGAHTCVQIQIRSLVNGKAKLTLYADSSGSPAARLKSEQEINCLADQQNTMTFTVPPSLTATDYWIAVNTDTVGTRGYKASAGVVVKYKAWTYGDAFPDPAGGGLTNDNDFSEGLRIVYCKLPADTMFFTKAVLVDDADPVISVSMFCHVASGHLRKAIFDDSAPKAKKWESDTVPTADDDWKVSGIGGGTPPTLALLAGTYHFGWQYDGTENVPSYTAGSAGDGFHKAQVFGSFPATIAGETSNSYKWSMYVTYTVASEEEAEEIILLSEGSNCHLVDYVEDYREIATVIILKAGKDSNGTDIIVTVSDEAAARMYGKLVLPFSESQWTTQLLAELRANQLLSIYKGPAITINVVARDCFVKKGDPVTLVSTTLGVNDIYIVESADHTYDEEGPGMSLQLKNMTASILDFLNLMQRNLERR